MFTKAFWKLYKEQLLFQIILSILVAYVLGKCFHLFQGWIAFPLVYMLVNPPIYYLVEGRKKLRTQEHTDKYSKTPKLIQ